MEHTLLGFKNGSEFYVQNNPTSYRILKYIDGQWRMFLQNDKPVYVLSNIQENQCVITSDGNLCIKYGTCLSLDTTYVLKNKELKMTTQKKYFKVVSTDLSSAVQGSNTIQYKVGEFVYPEQPGSCLFVFDSLESAKKAINTCVWTHKRIFECECHGVVDITTVDKSIWYPTKTIEGTVFAQAVKLTKEVLDDFVVSEGHTVYVQFHNSRNTYTCVLAQVGANKFQIFQKSDMNRIRDDIIEGSDGIRGVHGLRWSILQEYAEKHGFTIEKEQK